MKIFQFLVVAALVVLSYSCKKDTEGVSKVTTYPVFNIVGGPFYTTLAGPGTFVDPGVTATIGDKNYPVTTEGSVNLSTPGLYSLKYTASADQGGFSASTQRVVLITNTAITQNYSGTYDRLGAKSTVSLKTEFLGYYHMSNVWSAATVIPIDFVDLGGSNLLIVPGGTNFGRHQGTGVVQPNGDIWLTVTLLDQGPLTSVRKWVKQ